MACLERIEGERQLASLQAAKAMIEESSNRRLLDEEERAIRQALGLVDAMPLEKVENSSGEPASDNNAGSDSEKQDHERLNIAYDFEAHVDWREQEEFEELVEGFRRLGERCDARGLTKSELKKQVAEAMETGVA